MRKPRVCIVSSLPPFRSGISLYTMGLLSGFVEAKLLLPLTVVANKSSENIHVDVRHLRLLKTWTRGPKYIFQVLAVLIRERPSIVHLQHEFFLYGDFLSSFFFPFLLSLTKMLGFKVIVTMHGVVPMHLVDTEFADAFFIPRNSTALKFGLALLTILICRNADKIIVHNRFAEHVLHVDYRVPPQKIQVIHHGVQFWNSEKEKKQTSPLDEKIVLFFGNITPSKGIETLIKAFQKVQVQNAKLVIAGGPHPRGIDYFRRITSIVERSSASKSISMTGYIPDEKIHVLYEECEVVVFPYTCAISSSGGLSFALGHTKPLIVTDLPAFTEIIADKRNGLVVPPGESEPLARAIEWILSDHGLGQSLSAGIIKSCSNLAWPLIATRTCECYYETLGIAADEDSPSVS